MTRQIRAAPPYRRMSALNHTLGVQGAGAAVSFGGAGFLIVYYVGEFYEGPPCSPQGAPLPPITEHWSSVSTLACW